MKPIEILIVDDHPLLREVTKRRLELEDDMVVIAEASDGVEAVQLASEISPDIILMDVNMPEMDGVTATEKITSSNPQARIIGLSSNSREQFEKIMRQAGAVAYHTKSDGYDVICDTIRSKALNGRHWINRAIKPVHDFYISMTQYVDIKCYAKSKDLQP